MAAPNSDRLFGQPPITWAGIGIVFIINAFTTDFLIDDDGFVSSISALIALVALLLPILKTAWQDIKSGRTRMHELVVIAVVASCIQTGSRDADFTTSACIALFMLLSIIIESRTASGAQASLEALTKLSPDEAHRIGSDGKEEAVSPENLQIGDVLRVRPGENIIADGVIIQGSSSVNEASITGESLPVDKHEGVDLFAGTNNISGLLDYRITRLGADTTIGRVRELILNAEATRLPFTRMIDRYVRFYTPVVLMLAGAVLFFNRQTPDGFDRVVALLVATCPIALILATPTAVVAALSAAARLGVLIKDVNDIEAMARIDAFIFDKTGTLTTGELSVSRISPVDGIDPTDLLKAAASVASGSHHPVSRAVAALARKARIDLAHPSDLQEDPGRGINATVDAKRTYAGNLRYMQENGCDAESFPGLEGEDAASMSLLFVIQDGKAIGWIGVSDSARNDAAEALSELRDLNVRHLAIVSGDRQAVVSHVATDLTLDTAAGDCNPEQKVDVVHDLKNQGFQVAFVGDGVNDGPALASSNIGIAMGAAGSDVAIESATIALMNNDLNRLPFLLRLSRQMKQAILQNFTIGLLIVCGGIALAATGTLSPIIAAVLQVIGAIIVSMNSARLIREGEHLASSEND